MKFVIVLFDFIDQRAVIRRIVLGIVLWLQVDVIRWAMDNGNALSFEEIGAVTGPMSILLGAVIKFYGDSRNNKLQGGL